PLPYTRLFGSVVGGGVAGGDTGVRALLLRVPLRLFRPGLLAAICGDGPGGSGDHGLAVGCGDGEGAVRGHAVVPAGEVLEPVVSSAEDQVVPLERGAAACGIVVVEGHQVIEVPVLGVAGAAGVSAGAVAEPDRPRERGTRAIPLRAFGIVGGAHGGVDTLEGRARAGAQKRQQ